MTTTPLLTGRDIGQAESALRALLDRVLDSAGLSYLDWTVLSIVGAAGTLARSELMRRQSDAIKIEAAAAASTVDHLRVSGLLDRVDGARAGIAAPGEADDERLTLSESGTAVYGALRQRVNGITSDLWSDLPRADLEITHRTLVAITSRANARLAADVE